jgi:hypothetical protein
MPFLGFHVLDNLEKHMSESSGGIYKMKAPALRERGKARPDRQLSKLQYAILIWLLKKEASMLETPETLAELQRFGILWSAKRFCVETGRNVSNTNAADVSSALAALSGWRGLLKAHKVGGRTRWVKLTSSARELAFEYALHDKTRRQREDMAPKPYGLRQHIERRVKRIREGMS